MPRNWLVIGKGRWSQNPEATTVPTIRKENLNNPPYWGKCLELPVVVTDNVCGQISEDVFMPTRGYLFIYSNS